MAKRKKKEQKMTQAAVQFDGLESILTKSKKETIRGVTPRTARRQDDVLDILGQSDLSVIDDQGKEIDPNSPCGEIEWDDIRSVSKYSSMMNKPVQEWGGKQLFLHLKHAITNRYKKPWDNIAIAGGIQSIRLLGEEITKLAERKASSTLLKAYLDWFVANELDSYIAKKGEFFISSLRSKLSIKRFLKQYKEVSINAPENTEKEVDVRNIDYEEMDSIFRTSKILFITKYGIVIALNWLLSKKNYSLEKSISIVETVLSDSVKMNPSIGKEVAKATHSFSPYPASYRVEGVDKLLGIVNEKNIEFLETV